MPVQAPTPGGKETTAASASPIRRREGHEAATTAAVQARGVVRRFGTFAALGGVDLELRPGEVHALLGENGAGKTTLVRILAGLDHPTAGTVELWGEEVVHLDARAARRRGVALVQQHFTLVPTLTAAQNLVLARPTGFVLPSQRTAAKRLAALVERFGLDVRGDVPAGQLSVGEQQRLEILRALDADASVLLLDEPTAVLTGPESDALLGVCRRLADEGRAVVIITHRLAEVVAGCDRVTVLRDGMVVVAGADVDGQTPASLAAAMVGRAAAEPATLPPTPSSQERVRLQVDAISAGRLRPVSFAVRAGEVLGIAGVDGNGQAELEAVLAGITSPATGSVSVDGTPMPTGAPRQRIDRAIAYVPSDRYRNGMVRAMSLADNLELGRGRAWRPRRRSRLRAAAPQLDRWDVRAGGARAAAASLSGGNAQKLVLAREMHDNPALVLACHPTRGLDPAASATIVERVLAAAASGAAVVWIGVELEELLGVAHRVLVLAGGTVTGEFLPPFDRNAIGLAMGGHRSEESEES